MNGRILFDGYVAGRPTPKGSFKPIKSAGRVWLKPDSSDALSAWVANLRAAISTPHDVTQSAVSVDVTFFLARPKKHYTKKGLRLDAPTWVNRMPDLDKLLRAVLDALTGVVWHDDQQVVRVVAGKRWSSTGEEPGCELVISAVGERTTHDVDAYRVRGTGEKR
jgi:crossover junction endodeoxyribonuclease RusA